MRSLAQKLVSLGIVTEKHGRYYLGAEHGGASADEIVEHPGVVLEMMKRCAGIAITDERTLFGVWKVLARNGLDTNYAGSNSLPLAITEACVKALEA